MKQQLVEKSAQIPMKVTAYGIVTVSNPVLLMIAPLGISATESDMTIDVNFL